MKIQINREQKIQLLQVIKAGIFDSEIFPKLYNLEPARTLTKEEAQQLWSNLENGKFPKI